MQPAVDNIVALSLEADVAYHKHILGRHCGIHPENRGKTGVDPLNAQNLTLKISLPHGLRKGLNGAGCISP